MKISDWTKEDVCISCFPHFAAFFDILEIHSRQIVPFWWMQKPAFIYLLNISLHNLWNTRIVFLSLFTYKMSFIYINYRIMFNECGLKVCQHVILFIPLQACSSCPFLWKFHHSVEIVMDNIYFNTVIIMWHYDLKSSLFYLIWRCVYHAYLIDAVDCTCQYSF